MQFALYRIMYNLSSKYRVKSLLKHDVLAVLRRTFQIAPPAEEDHGKQNGWCDVVEDSSRSDTMKCGRSGTNVLTKKMQVAVACQAHNCD
jgi:hypothetical protein